MDEMYGPMYLRANEFYKTLGDLESHPLWLGSDLPHWFFVFILRYCTLIHVLQERQDRLKST